MNDHPASAAIHHLGEAPTSTEAAALFELDVEMHGFVMNASRLWAHQARIHDDLFDLIGASAAAAGLSLRQRGILVTAAAAARGDSYCALAWGARLAGESSPELAAGVLRGNDDVLDPPERALATWARSVVRDPNGVTAAGVSPLRDAGFDDAQILAITVFVGLRLAFSTVNDALGALPDHGLVDHAPAEVVDAVTYGRPVASAMP
jgi:alkylhydroperoxidase family enzyme